MAWIQYVRRKGREILTDKKTGKKTWGKKIHTIGLSYGTDVVGMGTGLLGAYYIQKFDKNTRGKWHRIEGSESIRDRDGQPQYRIPGFHLLTEDEQALLELKD